MSQTKLLDKASSLGTSYKTSALLSDIDTNLLELFAMKLNAFNVLDYGVDATGANACQDDIQTAVDAAWAVGGSNTYLDSGYGIVIIPAGKYLIDGHITLRSNVHIQISRNAEFKFPANYAGSVFYSNTRLVNCHITGGHFGNDTDGTTRTWTWLDLNFSDLNNSYGMFNKFSDAVIENCNIGVNINVTSTGWHNGNECSNLLFWRPIIGIKTATPAAGQVSGNKYINIELQTHSSYTTYGIIEAGAYNMYSNCSAFDISGTTKGANVTGTNNGFMNCNLGAVGTTFLNAGTGNMYICPADGNIYLNYGRKIDFYNGDLTLTHNASTGLNINKSVVVRGVHLTERHTIKKIIGINGVAGCDFNFAANANTTQQNLDLGAIIPAKARVKSIEIVCTAALTGGTITHAVGNASAGAQFIAAAGCSALNAVVGIIDATKPAAVAMNWAAATNIFIGSVPSANWSTLSTGKWTVYVTYDEYTNA